MSALPVGAALTLRADRGMFESAKLFDVIQGLENRVNDGVDFFLVTEEKIMREPDGFLVGGALGGRAAVHVSQIERFLAVPAQRGILRRVYREERAAIDGLVKKPVAGYTLELQRSHERGSRNVLHQLGEVFQHVRVWGRPGDARLRFQESQAARRAHARLEVLD